MSWLFLFVLAVAVSLYDARTGRIPIWLTIPLILMGAFRNFPGSAEIWLLAAILLLAFANGWMGAGDVKLWLTLAWLMPVSAVPVLLPAAMSAWLLSGLGQIFYRWLRNRPLTGISSPAAWRTIPFLALACYVH